MAEKEMIGFGGGCHWCTEAVFQALKGVEKVEQGYVASTGVSADFSEGVIVHYDPKMISLHTLIEVHLHTHNSTSNHSFRKKYRSAVYYLEKADREKSEFILNELQKDFKEKIITRVLPLREFKASRETIRDYYKKNPDAPFCKRFIEPKLEMLKSRFEIISRKERKV